MWDMEASALGHGAVGAPYLGMCSVRDMQKVILGHSMAPGPVLLAKGQSQPDHVRCGTRGLCLAVSSTSVWICMTSAATQAAAW